MVILWVELLLHKLVELLHEEWSKWEITMQFTFPVMKVVMYWRLPGSPCPSLPSASLAAQSESF